ncbi:MAG: protein translocase subunit SecF [Nitrospinales bacterium]
MEIFKKETHFDFMGKRKMAMAISGFFILASLASIVFNGGLKYGIDFAGGTLVQLQFKTPPDLNQIRDGLKEIGLSDSTIQEFGSKNDILIRVEKVEGKAKEGEGSEEKLVEMGTKIKAALGKIMNESDITIDRVEMVGPKVGKDLREKALLSILYAIFGIVIYVSWRFEFYYALAAIIALVHDVTITVGAFSLFDKEFTLVVVAAFLTIIGYSLNDTIVVFDRIRENTRRNRKGEWVNTVNTSINQTLSRTLLTSGTTLLVVVALFVLGGEIIHDFAFALMIGVFAGTYSSIFIASVFLIIWESKTFARKK